MRALMGHRFFSQTQRYMVTATVIFLALMAKQSVGQQATTTTIDTFVEKKHEYTQPKLIPKGSLADPRIVPLQDGSPYKKTSVLYNAANFNGTSSLDVYIEVSENDRIIVAIKDPEGAPCTSEESPIRLRINDADICGVFIWWEDKDKKDKGTKYCTDQGKDTFWKRRVLWSENRVNLKYDKSFVCQDLGGPTHITIQYECFNTPICPDDAAKKDKFEKYIGSHQAKISISRSDDKPLECNTTTTLIFTGESYDPEKSSCSAEPLPTELTTAGVSSGISDGIPGAHSSTVNGTTEAVGLLSQWWHWALIIFGVIMLILVILGLIYLCYRNGLCPGSASEEEDENDVTIDEIEDDACPYKGSQRDNRLDESVAVELGEA